MTCNQDGVPTDCGQLFHQLYNGDEFAVLRAAFSSNYCPNGDCANPTRPVYLGFLAFLGGDPGGGGGGNSSGNWFKRAVSAACSLVADAGTLGVGGDMGLGITGSGQLNLTANGASGELTLSLSQGLSGGVIGPDGYVSVSVTPNAPDNSFLDTHGQPSTSTTVGYSRYGASWGGGTYGVTLGPSLSPVTAAKSGMLSKPLITVPYAGYVAHPARAVCKAITGQ
jgi:hypothetical protein